MKRIKRGYWESKENILNELKNAYKQGININIAELNKSEFSSLSSAIGYHKYNLEELCKEINIPFSGRKTWNDERLEKELLDFISNENNLNYSSIKKLNNPLLMKCIKKYGSWKKTLESKGINYELVDQGDASRKSGRLFEYFVRVVFNEIGIKYDRVNLIEGCRPDFIFSENHWGDAKLSQWTIDDTHCNTIDKYSKHVDRLDIIYLRGDRNKEEFINEKVKLTSIYVLINKINNEKKKSEFIKKANSIWRKAERLEFIEEYNEEMIIEKLLEANNKGIILRNNDLKENGYGRLVYAIRSLNLSLPELRRKIGVELTNKKGNGYWKNKDTIIKEAIKVYKSGVRLTGYSLIKNGYSSLAHNIQKNWSWSDFRKLINEKYILDCSEYK